jgi:hypothetical protein
MMSIMPRVVFSTPLWFQMGPPVNIIVPESADDETAV